jgi:hypothetical protein
MEREREKGMQAINGAAAPGRGGRGRGK